MLKLLLLLNEVQHNFLAEYFVFDFLVAVFYVALIQQSPLPICAHRI